MATPLGSGGARYRAGGRPGPVDTVYLGVFRREALEAAGGFDGRLDRNEDYELNWRLRRRGGTVWFDPALRGVYRPGARRAHSRASTSTTDAASGGRSRCTRGPGGPGSRPRRCWC